MTPRTFDAEVALRDDRWIRGLARSLVQDGSEAEDALQEARLALMRSPPPRLADPRPWLARVALNFVRKRRREETRRRQREQRAARPEGLISSPEAAMERVELRRQVLQAVIALEEPYRSILVLRFFEEMSLKEIAGSAGIPVNTVKTRLSRALGIIRRRLETRYGGDRTWAVLLLPFLAPDLRVASALASAPAAKGAAGTGFTSSGVASMSVKGIVVAAGISGAVLLGGLAVVQRWVTSAPADASAAGKAGVSWAAPKDPGESNPPSSIARGEEEPANSLEGSTQTSLPVLPDLSGDAADPVEVGPSEPHPPSSTASQEALATREAIRLLRDGFGEGGGTGWRAVGKDIARLQEVILASPEGFREFLALLDEETDHDFLEALLHHLPLAGNEHRQGILDSRDLHQEIWARFEGSEDPTKQAAFLRFFAYNRALSSSRMDDFIALAGSEADQRVRRIAVDAIASNPDLIANTWEVLAHAVEYDPDPECRENALGGLAHAEAEGATALVNAAFSSPDERLRAAAIESAAGGRIPEEVTGGDGAAYLVREFQAARTARYRKAILKRFVGDPQQVFEDEIRRAMGEERDMGIREQYREALRMIEEARAARAR